MAGSAVWTTPIDWVNGVTILDTHLNPQIRDNLTWTHAAITGSDGITGQVTNLALAANAATQPITVSAFDAVTTASASYVDLANMSATFTARGSGPVLALFQANFIRSGGSDASFQLELRIDNASNNWWPVMGAGSTDDAKAIYHLFSTPAAGSRTVKVVWRVTANTVQCVARRLIIIELAK